MRLVLLLLSLACGGSSLKGSNPQADRHRITQTIIYTSWQAWDDSPFYRVSDMIMSFPIFVLVDNMGYGCVVTASVWAISRSEESCDTKWRAPRRK